MDTLEGLQTQNGVTIMVTAWVFLVLAAASVALRFLSKRLIRTSPGADDWLALGACVTFSVVEALVLRCKPLLLTVDILWTDPYHSDGSGKTSELSHGPAVFDLPQG